MRATVATVLVPKEGISPYNSAPWMEVFELMGERFQWEGCDLSLQVFAAESMQAKQQGAFEEAMKASDVFVAVGMHDAQAHGAVMQACQFSCPVSLIFDSSPELQALSRIAGLPIMSLPEPLLGFVGKLPGRWGAAARVWPTLREMWLRRSSDDLAFMLLLAINDFVTPVPSTQVNTGDAQSFISMCTKCQKQIVACVQDPQCKKALDGLAACGLNDQVCSYRVLASYESPLLEDFSKCILQRHNCLRNSASIPMVPDPTPMSDFRGVAMTHEIAEDLFVGHLAPGSECGHEFSWRVACGKNPAYDFFPCQYQLWYRERGKKAMWYDPIFKVQTLDGRVVWRRRHYRVRRAATPGAFYFSVLDNGVTSNEHWRIMDVAEDMEWAVFYYAGAASTAGITYRGALICTASGELPRSEGAMERVNDALLACGIRPWEMFSVDNTCCDDAPLSVPAYGNTAFKAIGPTFPVQP